MPTLYTGAMVILLLGLMLIIEIYTIIYLCKKRSSVKNITLRASDFPLGLFIRTTSYTVIGGSAIAITDILINDSDDSGITAQHVLAISLAFL